MIPAAGTAVLVLMSSLMTAGVGALVIRQAHDLPAPRAAVQRRVTGAVVDVLATSCRSRRRPGTCYRPVVGYSDRGVAKQVMSRSLYRPTPPHRKGDAVAVVVDADGEAWIAPEWDARQVVQHGEYLDARRFRLAIGWLLVGCAGVGVLVAVGIAFAKPAR